LLVLVEAEALLRICLSGILLLLGLSIVALIARVFIIDAFFGLVLLGGFSVALYSR
jgi:hypothetical protein